MSETISGAGPKNVQSDGDSRIVVIVNPTSGGGRLRRTWPQKERELRPLLESKGFTDIEVVFTTETDHGSGAVREAVKGGLRNIAVAGGDGTLSEVVQGLFEGPGMKPVSAGGADGDEVNLIVLPTGRGNDFFKSLVDRKFYSELDPWRRGLNNLREGLASPIDAGCMDLIDRDGTESSRVFINIASFGYPGLVVQRVHGREGWVGKSPLGSSSLTYLAQSTAALLKYKPLQMIVKVDDRVVHDGAVFSGFVLNGAYNGGGMCWSREARVDDGRFDLYLSEPQSAVASVSNLPRMYSGDWDGVKGVHLHRGKSVELRLKVPDAKTHRIFDIDGDQPERPTTIGGRFTVMPSALRVWRA